MSNVTQTNRIRRLQRPALWVAAGGLLVALAGFFLDRTEFWHAYLFAYIFWLEIALGGLGLVLLHHLAGGRWSGHVRCIAESAALTLPACGLLFLPLLVALPQLYPWAESGQMAASELLRAKSGWLNASFFVGRAVVYFVVWGLLAFRLHRLSRTRESGGDGAASRSRRLGAVGMILFVLTTTFAAFDWMMSLEPAWFSSIYGLLFLAGQAVAGISTAIIGLAATPPPSLPHSGGGAVSPSNDPHSESGDALSSSYPHSAGGETTAPSPKWGGPGWGEEAEPPPSLPQNGGGAVSPSNDPHSDGEESSAPSPKWGGLGWGDRLQSFNDLGNLLLAALMVWAYFAFSQYLIIWSANIPEEAVWYAQRSRGGWQWVVLGAIGLHFVLPFLFLLSRRVKRNPLALAWLAGLLLCARALDIYWLIVPAFHPAGVYLNWLYPLLLLGMGGGWVALFLQRWTSGALVPAHDPRL